MGIAAGDFSFVATRVGDSANVGLQFYEHLGDSPLARGFGVPADLALPGISLENPPTRAGYPDDGSPRSETNALKGNVVTVSVIQGTYAADDPTRELVDERLRSLFRPSKEHASTEGQVRR